MVESFNELGQEIEWTQQIFNEAFDELDTNKNGTIEKNEIFTFFKELAQEDDVREAEKKKRQAAKYHENKTPITLDTKGPTEAEKKLKEEAEMAKTKLIEEIKSFKTED